MKKTTITTVPATTPSVWRALTCPEVMALWMKGAEKVRTSDGETVSPKNRIRFDARGKSYESRVVEFEEGKRLAIESHQGPFCARYRYELADEGNSTRLTLTIEFTASGLANIVAPLIARAVWRTDRDQGERIKAALESVSREVACGNGSDRSS